MNANTKRPSLLRTPLLLLALLAPSLLLQSCLASRQSRGEPYAPEALEQIVPGKTTAREVVELLGAPSDVVRMHKGSAYLFEHSKTKTGGFLLVVVVLANTDQRSDRIWVFFDENDVVTHVGSDIAADRTEYALPWETIHDHYRGRK
jgi:outer membrane protein assembly factor BamE (lipoprotein component of BamABCDE complex)